MARQKSPRARRANREARGVHGVRRSAVGCRATQPSVISATPSMLEGALPRILHGHLGLGLVAGHDGLEVTGRSPGLEDGGDPLADTHVRPVPEGKEGVGDHD